MDQDSAPGFQLVFNTLPGNFVVLQPNAPTYTVLAMSDYLLRITGREREEVVGKSIFEAYPENPEAVTSTGPANLRASLQHVMRHKKRDVMPAVRYDVPTTEEAFEERYWSSTNTPVLDPDGEVLYILHSTEDITTQVKAEKKETKLRQIDKTYSLLMQAPVAVCILTGPEYIVELANEESLKPLGRSTDIIGMPLFQSVPETREQGILKLLDQVRTTGKTLRATEYPLPLKLDGKEEKGYYNLVLQPYYEETDDKVPAGVFIVANDVTEQVVAGKKTEESQEALKRFKFMADQARDAFILMRKDGTFAYLNQKALEAWDYPKEEAAHIRVPDVDAVYDDELYLQLFARAQKETIPQFETLHKRRDGYVFPVEVTVVGLQLGEEPYLFAIARDITERRKSEAALALKNEQLVHINNDLDNFIYTASHDLRTPITNIEGLLSLLSDDFKSGSVEEDDMLHMMGMMQESVERFKKTIDSLTDVVKLQQENSADATLVELAEVVREVSIDLKSMMVAFDAQLEVDLAGCPAIRFSEKNLRSVVYNLLSNAIKYRSPERAPRIQVGCESTPEYQVLTVKDNGLGIEDRHVEELFTMFRRFHDHVEGTGIGLYMVKKMVDNAGGYIEVDSQLGQGTTIRVYFKR